MTEKLVNPTRNWPASFGPVIIAPLEEKRVTGYVQPRCLFRGERLLNIGDAEGLIIKEIRVGDKLQEPYQGVAVANCGENQLKLQTCLPDESITFVVENRGTSPATFAIVIHGSALF